RRGIGIHLDQGARQRQRAGDLRAAPGVGLCPICGPGQKLDHPHRRREAARMTNDRPRNIANDMLDPIETATKKWTRQKRSEERHPGMVHHRVSRLTKEPRTTQKEAAWEIMEEAYMAASANDTLPAKARQVFYQARPKIMAMTDGKELDYGYFSQTLLQDYIEEHGVDWNVVYDARGHFEEPHTNRRIGCGTLEVDNYLTAMQEPGIIPPEFSEAGVDIIGPSGGF